MGANTEGTNGVESVKHNAGQQLLGGMAFSGRDMRIEFDAHPAGVQAAQGDACAVLINVSEIDDANGAALGVAARGA